MWGRRRIDDLAFAGAEIISGCCASLASNFIKSFKKDLNSGYFSDDTITTSLDHIKAQDKCNPVSDDFEVGAKEAICGALRKQNADVVREAVDDGQTVLARPWCVDLIKASYTMICSCGPTIIKEATFNLLGC
jgi:hypothetical protein